LSELRYTADQVIGQCKASWLKSLRVKSDDTCLTLPCLTFQLAQGTSLFTSASSN